MSRGVRRCLAWALLILAVVPPGQSRAGEAASVPGLRIPRTPDGLIAVGGTAPDFSLPDANGKRVRLRDLLGRPLVVYFYPMDETPGCTAQACAFRDDARSFDSLGVRVIGISTDGTTSHRSFADRHHLPFTLLSDSLAGVCRLYGVAHEIQKPGSNRTIARRVTYLIDRKGKVAHVWPKVDPAGNSTEVLMRLRAVLKDLKR